MSNIKSYFEMRRWVPEAINNQEEKDLLINGVLHDLKGQDPGQTAVSVCGDTLIFGSLDEDNNYCIYECQITRASANLVLEHPVVPNDGSIN